MGCLIHVFNAKLENVFDRISKQVFLARNSKGSFNPIGTKQNNKQRVLSKLLQHQFCNFIQVLEFLHTSHSFTVEIDANMQLYKVHTKSLTSFSPYHVDYICIILDAPFFSSSATIGLDHN